MAVRSAFGGLGNGRAESRDCSSMALFGRFSRLLTVLWSSTQRRDTKQYLMIYILFSLSLSLAFTLSVAFNLVAVLTACMWQRVAIGSNDSCGRQLKKGKP